MSEIATTARPALSGAARTDPGRVRSNNEDVPLLDVERGVLGVIDGVGGQAAGELAAAIAREVILQRLARPLGTAAERVREAIAIANNEIFRRAGTAPELAGMTCVVTLALVADGRLTVGHVGDTRLYKIRPGSLRKLTRDHSPVGEREDAHEIGELEAMRHPRRHEVFRDVGSALRDKDEDDYVDVVEEALEADAAVLVCSDGLTDMIPSATIERLVREHAGDPDAVVDALVRAANEAGGRDNVTAVYAEGPAFAAAVRGSDRPVGATESGRAVPASPARVVRRVLGAVVASRTTWFACGVLLGVLGALLLVWRTSEAPPVGGRTLVAAPVGTGAFGTLAAAVADARPGDVVRLEPGTYAEQVVLPSGVSLTARVAGEATFVRAPGVAGDWVAITATGDTAGAISGVRVASTPDLPVQVGIRVAGHGRSIALIEIDGPVRAGVELAPASSSSLHGSRFSVSGPAVVVAEGSMLDATGNVFVAGVVPPPTTPPPPSRRPSRPAPSARRAAATAITLGDAAALTLRRNVFAGYGAEPVQGLPPGAREPLRADNVVISADPSTLR